MIFDSDHAFISKWWWIGAIRNTRRPRYLNVNTWMITDSASNDVDAADEEQQHLRLHHDHEPRHRATQRHRARIAHEHFRGNGVVPEETDRGSDQRSADDRKIELGGVSQLRWFRGADERDHGHRREREERDDRRACGEPVESVGEIDAVRRAGDDEEDEDVPEGPEREAIAGSRNEHRRQVRQAGAVREVARSRRDTGEQQELPAS